jgi:hypothetical protein
MPSGDYLEVHEQDDVEYLVTLTYLDMPGAPEENNVRTVRVLLKAKDVVQAVSMAATIDMVNKAEMMTDYINTHPSLIGKKVFTKDEIDNLRQQAIDNGVFASWLMHPASAIQVVQYDKAKQINDIVLNDVMEHASHLGDQAEEFLKDIDEGKDGA